MTHTPPQVPHRTTRRTRTTSEASIGIQPRTVSTQQRQLPADWKPNSIAPGWTSTRYREQLGWATEQRQGRTFLFLERSMAAVVVPRGLAPRVSHQLERDDVCGPVLSQLGDEPSWVFLADPNGLVVARQDLPVGVVVLGCPSQIPIPAAGTSSNQICWSVPPNPSRRWLPTVSAVLCAVGWRGPQPEHLLLSRAFVRPWG